MGLQYFTVVTISLKAISTVHLNLFIEICFKLIKNKMYFFPFLSGHYLQASFDSSNFNAYLT